MTQSAPSLFGRIIWEEPVLPSTPSFIKAYLTKTRFCLFVYVFVFFQGVGVALGASSLLIYCMERTRLLNEVKQKHMELRDRALMISAVFLDSVMLFHLYTHGSPG